MKKLYHGSPALFDHFQMNGAGRATGIKYGYGVYLTEVEGSAVHYSQPRKMDFAPKHYLYTVEIPELVEGEYLVSALPVNEEIVAKVEKKMGTKVPEKMKEKGLEFRKWIGKTLTGTKMKTDEEKLAAEMKAAELLESVGVHYNVWPQAQTVPDGPKNIAVFNPERVKIVKVEEIEIEDRRGKWVRVSRNGANAYSVVAFIYKNYREYWGIQSYPAHKCANFCSTDEKWGIFGNFAAAPLVVDGYSFKHSEELFQMMKFKDENVLSNLKNGISRTGKSCHNIKKCAKSYEKDHRREDWGEMIVDAIKFCLQTKYEQCPKFRQELMWTQKLGLYIVEDQTSFSKQADAWGAKLKGNEFVGPNVLGRLLMELRDNGKLEYKLPDDAFDFIKTLKNIS